MSGLVSLDADAANVKPDWKVRLKAKPILVVIQEMCGLKNKAALLLW